MARGRSSDGLRADSRGLLLESQPNSCTCRFESSSSVAVAAPNILAPPIVRRARGTLYPRPRLGVRSPVQIICKIDAVWKRCLILHTVK